MGCCISDNQSANSIWSDPSKRNLFRYHDGTRERVGDPVEIARKFLYESGIDVKEDLGVIKSPLSDEARITAISRVSAAMREAFGIKELGIGENGEVVGMSDTELFDHVLTPFVNYVDALKKNGEST